MSGADGWADFEISAGDFEGWQIEEKQASTLYAYDDFEQPESAIASRPDYEVLNRAQLYSAMRETLTNLADLLFLTEDQVASLMRKYSWDIKKLNAAWLEDPERIRRIAGLPRPKEGESSDFHPPPMDAPTLVRALSRQNSFSRTEDKDDKDSDSSSKGPASAPSASSAASPPASITTYPPGTMMQCNTAYCDEVPAEEGAALGCGHFFCADCWSNLMWSEYEKHGRQVLHLSCPGRDKIKKPVYKEQVVDGKTTRVVTGYNEVEVACESLIPMSFFQKFIADRPRVDWKTGKELVEEGKEAMTKCILWMLDSYVESTGNMRWCPNPNCERDARAKSSDDEDGDEGEVVPDFVATNTAERPEETLKVDFTSPPKVESESKDNANTAANKNRLPPARYISWNHSKVNSTKAGYGSGPYVIRDPHGDLGAETVECECGHTFCFKCNAASHAPAPCDLAKSWMERCGTDEATRMWLAARTKPCPQCKVRTEKNRACNHMTCAKCRFEYCWLCLKPWSEHGSSTGGYYVCENFNKGNVDESVKNATDMNSVNSNLLLQKYQYYYKRYQQHSEGVQLARQLHRQIERHLRKAASSAVRAFVSRTSSLRTALLHSQPSLQHQNSLSWLESADSTDEPPHMQPTLSRNTSTGSTTGSTSGEDLTNRFHFVQQALSEVIRSRNALQWLFALGYHMRSDASKRLFETQVDMLVQACESVHDLIESNHLDLNKLERHRKDIVDGTAAMERFRNSINAAFKRGDYEDLLQNEADAGELSKNIWICTNCNKEHPITPGVTPPVNCGCGACRLHGELDCNPCNRH